MKTPYSCSHHYRLWQPGFCCGWDIRGFAGLSKEEGMSLAKQGMDVFSRLKMHPSQSSLQ
jgi:hypothetical protein